MKKVFLSLKIYSLLKDFSVLKFSCVKLSRIKVSQCENARMQGRTMHMAGKY